MMATLPAQGFAGIGLMGLPAATRNAVSLKLGSSQLRHGRNR
ncbi:hypothetical protein [Pseudomonas sp. QTF5]|nr:hypothetical protein [Pseudomonas sp. QTF5]